MADFANNEQYNYTYDANGNIKSLIHYEMDSAFTHPISTLQNYTYTYGKSTWGNLLIKFNGQTITYDQIGNPLNYRDGITMTWQNGGELATYEKGNVDVTYTYDPNGLRTRKQVLDGFVLTDYNYVYENGLLVQMTYGNHIYNFSYDANGTPVSLNHIIPNAGLNDYYYYGVNSRGDVEALYYGDGSLYATYDYDAYGKLLAITSYSGSDLTNTDTVANNNPLRYRSYVYDTETGLYYLQSRYYDPTTCRFINADIYYETGQGIIGYNMFAYCNNNPVMYSDPAGTRIFDCCPYGDCPYCKAENNADVLVISNSSSGWMDSSETMGEDMVDALDVDSSCVKGVRTDNFIDVWANTNAECIIIHTHGSPNALQSDNFYFTTSDMEQLPINHNVKLVLVTACSVGGNNNGMANIGQCISKKIAPNGIVVCSTTVVSGGSKSFTATNNGKWIAYHNAMTMAVEFPTTITMGNAAEYWKSLIL